MAKCFPKAAFLSLALMLVVGAGGAWAQEAAATDPGVLAVQVTHMGFRCNVGGGGALTTTWTTGNLGNEWDEGEWVPYQVIITGIQSVYPNFVGMPDIDMSFDFTNKGVRAVDLIRAIQVGQQALVDPQGFPSNTGSALPVSTVAEVNAAQNYDGEWAWQLGGAGNFTLLNLPDDQIMRPLGFPPGDTGTATDERKYMKIKPSDLVAAGIPNTADVVVIYYQLHESRTFVWTNSLQSVYDQNPTDGWGGYLYSLPAYSSDMRNGSGYVSGSSLHTAVAFAGEKTVPIPLAEAPEGVICGLKWYDTSRDGIIDPGEAFLSGWRIYVSGEVENIPVMFSILTDGTGQYCFDNLTSDSEWYICEDEEREVPVETNYDQTYPYSGVVYGGGEAYDCSGDDPDYAGWGWHVVIPPETPYQDGMDFGNVACTPPLCNVTPHAPICDGGTISLNASSTGDPAPTFCWQYSSDGSSYGSCIATTEDYSFGPVTTSDEGYYRLRVTNPCGVSYCSTYVRVDEVATCSIDPVGLTCTGDGISLNATVVEDPDLTTTYCWRFKPDAGSYGGCEATTEDWVVTGSATTGDQGWYKLEVTNDCGTTACSTYVRVDQKATCSIDPVGLTCTGDGISLNATVVEDPDLTTTYCWRFKPDAGSYGSCEAATEDWVVTGSATTGDQGWYKLEVTNDCGTTACSTYVRVDEVATCTIAPPGSKCLGSTISLDATVVEDPDLTTTYCWRFKPDAGSYGSCEAATEDWFVTGSATAGDQGWYKLEVTNDCGTTACSVYVRVDEGPACSIAAVGLTCEGDPISLDATVTTDPDLTTTYCWEFRAPMGSYPGGCEETTEDWNVTSSATTADEGWYRLTVSNSCGSSMCSTYVRVDVPPTCTIATVPPQCEGDDFILNSTAVDDADLTTTYCWQFRTPTGSYPGGCFSTDPDPLVGPVDTGDEGWYRLTVSNSCGSSMCSTYVRVDEKPTCSIATVPPQCEGDQIDLDATVTEDADLTTTYCWEFRTPMGSYPGGCEETTEDWTPTTDATTADEGWYRLTVSNSCGSSMCSTYVRVDEAPTCSFTHDDVCEGSAIDFTPTVNEDSDLTTTYCWEFREDGGDYPGGCEATTKNWMVTSGATAADEGWYRLTVSNDCGSSMCSVFVDVYDITVALTCPDPVPDCNGEATIDADVTSEAGMVVLYSWSVSGTGWNAVGSTTGETFTYTTGDCGSQGMIILTVRYEEDTECADTDTVYCGCECRGFCSFTMGAWGSKCPTPHPPTQPGCIRDDYFSWVYASAGVWIGDPDGHDADGFYAAHWPNAAAVQQFLPSGGPGLVLAGDVTFTSSDPRGDNTLLGQVLALRLNVDYSCAGVYTDLGLLDGGVACYGDFTIPPECGHGVFDGWTVYAFLATADSVVGGLTSGVTAGADSGTVKGTAGCLNELYDECNAPEPDAFNPGPVDEPSITPADNLDTLIPEFFEVKGAFPNPANPSATIHFAVPMDSRVTVEIFDVQGKSVVTLIDQNIPAGYHSIAWDGKTSSGMNAGTGVYFCRVQCCDGQQITEKMIKLK